MKRIPESEAIADMAEAQHFDEMMGDNWLRQQEYRQLARQLVELGLPEGGRVLDLGTGPGFVAIEVARLLQGRGCQVVGLDLSEAMLGLAAGNAERAGLNGSLTWRKGDAKAMPFADDEFDLIVSNDSLHHWDDPLPVFDEIARVLKPGGKCIVHDSKRLHRCLPCLFVWAVETVMLGSAVLQWAIGRTGRPDLRRHWRNSIRSSYTPDEMRAVLERSRLQGWRIEEDFLDLTVTRT